MGCMPVCSHRGSTGGVGISAITRAACSHQTSRQAFWRGVGLTGPLDDIQGAPRGTCPPPPTDELIPLRPVIGQHVP
ncbi:unnamed protein product [Arctogadus glacialis]